MWYTHALSSSQLTLGAKGSRHARDGRTAASGAHIHSLPWNITVQFSIDGAVRAVSQTGARDAHLRCYLFV